MKSHNLLGHTQRERGGGARRRKVSEVVVTCPVGCCGSWTSTKDSGMSTDHLSLKIILPYYFLPGSGHWSRGQTTPKAGCAVCGKSQAPTQVTHRRLGFEVLAVVFCLLSFNGELQGRGLKGEEPVNAVSEWAICSRNKSSSPSLYIMKVHPPIMQAFIKAGKGGGIHSIPKRSSDENLTSFDFDAFQRKSVS